MSNTRGKAGSLKARAASAYLQWTETGKHHRQRLARGILVLHSAHTYSRCSTDPIVSKDSLYPLSCLATIFPLIYLSPGYHQQPHTESLYCSTSGALNLIQTTGRLEVTHQIWQFEGQCRYLWIETENTLCCTLFISDHLCQVNQKSVFIQSFPHLYGP